MAARLLLAAGADPTRASQGNGWTALMFAAEEGHLDLVQLLASFGTDVDAADDGGYTAQDIASREGHMDVEGWRAEVDNWPTFKIAVGCREVAAAKCMLRGGRVDPASCSLVELDLIANTAADKYGNFGILCFLLGPSREISLGSMPTHTARREYVHLLRVSMLSGC